jgi:hypothetical protein
MSNELTTARPAAALATLDLSPRTLEEALRMCDLLADSEIIPKDYQRKPGNIMVAIQWGAEVGLKPLQAMQNIAVINGRPSLWGDALLALVRASPLCEYVVEGEEGDTAWCRVKRRGEPEQMRTFSAADAKTAGLAGKSGPWSQYPKRMRQLRARAFALRDVFPDVLKGMPVAEEVMDYPPVEEVPARQQTATQIAAAAAPKAERTEKHAKLIEQLEMLAYESGFQTFKDAWAALPKEDRAAIGLAERDRIGDIGHETDKKAGVVQPEAEGAASHE